MMHGSAPELAFRRTASVSGRGGPPCPPTPLPSRTLSEAEQACLLKTTGERPDGFRDHVIFAVALGTGLRSTRSLR